jgi:hypothetical protein
MHSHAFENILRPCAQLTLYVKTRAGAGCRQLVLVAGGMLRVKEGVTHDGSEENTTTI